MRKMEPAEKWKTQRWPCRVRYGFRLYWASNPDQLETLLRALERGNHELADRYAASPSSPGAGR